MVFGVGLHTKLTIEVLPSTKFNIASEPYPSASGRTKCCRRQGKVCGRTNHEQI